MQNLISHPTDHVGTWSRLERLPLSLSSKGIHGGGGTKKEVLGGGQKRRERREKIITASIIVCIVRKKALVYMCCGWRSERMHAGGLPAAMPFNISRGLQGGVGAGDNKTSRGTLHHEGGREI